MLSARGQPVGRQRRSSPAQVGPVRRPEILDPPAASVRGQAAVRTRDRGVVRAFDVRPHRGRARLATDEHRGGTHRDPIRISRGRRRSRGVLGCVPPQIRGSLDQPWLRRRRRRRSRCRHLVAIRRRRRRRRAGRRADTARDSARLVQLRVRAVAQRRPTRFAEGRGRVRVHPALCASGAARRTLVLPQQRRLDLAAALLAGVGRREVSSKAVTTHRASLPPCTGIDDSLRSVVPSSVSDQVTTATTGARSSRRPPAPSAGPGSP